MLFVTETILFYGNGLLNALKNVAVVNMNKVTMDLEIEVGGKMGVPFITEGTAESYLRVMVKCLFPVKNEARQVNQGDLFH